VLAPVAEELFFRGYFFTALRNWKGVWPAAILTGVVFGAIHAGSAPVGYLVPLAVFGFALCLLYWRTGSLYPCIVLHALNNSLAFGVSQGWGWEIPLVMLGANAVILAALLPFRVRVAT
jgi:membrane protease YdiL (CAAX protease family)